MKTLSILFIVFIFPWTKVIAAITLPRLIDHGMVLQRNQPVKIWGWADPAEQIVAKIDGHTYQTQTAENGEWEIILSPFEAGGPYSLYLEGTNHEIAIHNILFGDVWLCSGQSNMELPIRRVLDLYESEIRATTNDQIRFFSIPTGFKFGTPDTDLKAGQWTLLNPSTALQMSAVAYFFAQDLYQQYNIPIGLIINAVGGSPAEAWLSEETISKYPVYAAEYQKLLNPDYIEYIRKTESSEQSTWHGQMHQQDRGITEQWQYGPASATWKDVPLPAQWNVSWFPEIENANKPIIGSVWFKKDFILDKVPNNASVRLDMGAIIDADEAYINGLPIGATSYRYPPRIYTFHSSLLREGQNVITVRVRSYGENGQFIPEKPYTLRIGDNMIDLKTDWKYQLGYHTEKPLPGTTFFHYKPSGLYNALLHPLKNLRLKGILWYQGESNTRDPEEYRHLFADIISDWRLLFKKPDLPFLYVQLANYMRDEAYPNESNWAELRQVQLESLHIPNTAMVTTIDIGEWNDIHPLNKKDVGKRLALAARKVAYGDDVTHSGPLYRSHRIEDNKIFVYFDHIGKGLDTKDGKALKHIAIAGVDGKFAWAEAEVKEDHIIIQYDLEHPLKVRYAWGYNPESANLINKNGLPAPPFLIDLTVDHGQQ